MAEVLENPAEKRAAADLAVARFRAGIARGQWRQLYSKFPVLIIALTATEESGVPSEYAFRFELTGFPGAAPQVVIWDVELDAVLAFDKRPKGSKRTLEAFKEWGSTTGNVYRPWEREGLDHNGWRTAHPTLTWIASRDITLILEDLYAILNGYPRAI